MKSKEKVAILTISIPSIEYIWLVSNTQNIAKFCETIILREIRKMMQETVGKLPLLVTVKCPKTKAR